MYTSACVFTQLMYRKSLRAIEAYLRATRLENLCRFRTDIDSVSECALCRRLSLSRFGCDSLCSGFKHHRFVHEHVSMGEIPQDKRYCQNAHAFESKRQYSRIRAGFRCDDARCKGTGHSFFRCREATISWIGPIWTIRVSTISTRRKRSSLHGQKGISISVADTPVLSTKALV